MGTQFCQKNHTLTQESWFYILVHYTIRHWHHCYILVHYTIHHWTMVHHYTVHHWHHWSLSLWLHYTSGSWSSQIRNPQANQTLAQAEKMVQNQEVTGAQKVMWNQEVAPFDIVRKFLFWINDLTSLWITCGYLVDKSASEGLWISCGAHISYYVKWRSGEKPQ